MKALTCLVALHLMIPSWNHFLRHSLLLFCVYPIECQNPFTGETRNVSMPVEDVTPKDDEPEPKQEIEKPLPNHHFDDDDDEQSG